MAEVPVDPRSVLLVTLDSCRFDTFAAAAAPHLKGVGPLHRAQSPSYFTFGAHAAIFMGFTAAVPGSMAPVLNPKFSKLFQVAGGGSKGHVPAKFRLEGRTVIEGFRKAGYRAVGAGAVGWFNDQTPTGRVLTEDFDAFFYAGDTWSLARQLEWLDTEINAAEGPVFAFLNVGETHVPYYFEGAPWDRKDNPCRPFQTVDRADECRHRQALCLEFVDEKIAPLLARFSDATIMVCADHGDCWGEDGLWEHGVSHPATLTVPLLVRHAGAPISDLADPGSTS